MGYAVLLVGEGDVVGFCLAAVCLRQQQGQQVEEFMIETLVNLDEQLWNENGFLRELGKPKQYCI